MQMDLGSVKISEKIGFGRPAVMTAMAISVLVKIGVS